MKTDGHASPARKGRTLRQNGLLMVAVPLIFEIAFALVVLIMDQSMRREQKADLVAEETVASAYHLLQLVVDTETATRGYIITAEPAFIEPYDRAIREVPVAIGRLRALTAALPLDVAPLDVAIRPVLEYHAAQRMRVASGNQIEAANVVVSGDGKRKTDAFRAAMNQFLADHHALEQARTGRSARARRGLRNVILGGLLMNIVVAAAMAVYFTSSITRRLAVVMENTFRIERQEPLRSPLRGNDEIAQLDGRFHSMATALEKSHRELEAFSYSVSHDLRAPLRAVNGYARMVEEDFAEKLDGDGKRYLGTIRSEANRMGQLIDELLAFSRLGRQPLRVAPVDVEQVAREALVDVPGAADERVSVTFDAIPAGLADRAMLRQVFANLLSNAIKFSSRNAETRVEVGGFGGESENVYWVRDHGAGFDMRFADKLFGVFQRLHAVHEFEGTGVGLAIVHRVVDRHGGRVWAEAEEGRGACFYFTLSRPREDEA